MRYPQLWARLYGTPLLIHPDKAQVIERVFRARLSGQKLDAGAISLMEDGEEDPRAAAERAHQRRMIAYAGIPLQRRDDKPYAVTESGIAIIPVLGTLVQRGSWLDAMSGLTSYDGVASMIEDAAGDAGIRAGLFEFDTPGGEGNGIVEMAARIVAARATKPFWASVNEQAYSAGYWMACSADRVYVPITGGVGSIGAVALHVDQSARDARDGYTFEFVYDGARKIDGNAHEPLSDPARKWLQAEVDRFGLMFREHVAAMRDLSEATVRATQAGLLTPPAALEGRYVDGIATLAETVAALESDLRQQSEFTGMRLAARRLSTRKETTMSEPKKAAATEPSAEQPSAAQVDAQIAAARTAARSEGEEAGRIEGAKAERTRIAGILGNSEAAGRGKLALHLALETDSTLEAATKLLAAAPKEADKTASSFAGAMAALKNPSVGADTGEPAAGSKPRLDSAAIYAARAGSAQTVQ